MPLGTSLPYGMRDIQLLEYPTLIADTFGSVLTDLPNAQTMSFTDAEEYNDLRGDDRLVTSHGQGSQVDWEMTSGGISFEAHTILAGGEVIETGIAPNQVKRYRKYANDQRPFFVALGQAISDSGGDFHAVLWLCRSTGNVEGQLNDGEFLIPSVSGIGFPARASGMVNGLPINGAIYDFVQNETITALTAPTMDTPSVPVVYGLSDNGGPTAGGEIVRVYGEGFVGVTAVHAAVTAVTEYEIVSPYELIIVTPARTAGPANIRVTTPAGQSATGDENVYTYA